jgi:DNA-binding CsgD family transcriptional regulator
VAAELAMESGDPSRAAQLLSGLHVVVDPDGNEEELVVTYSLRARLAAIQGDEAAIRTLLAALSNALSVYQGHHESGSGDLWYHALMSAVRAGFPVGEVEALLAQMAHPDGGRAAQPADPAWPVHLDAALAECRGQPAQAAAAYAAAAVDGPVRRSPPVLADAHLGAARSLLALDRLDEARAHAETAQEILARWPGWRRDEVTALLHRLGQGRGQASGVGGLTNRELEVVGLVAQGLTNGQIAARLFISTKTASVHVSNVLRKVGLTSRRQLAEWSAAQVPEGATSSTSKPSPSSR